MKVQSCQSWDFMVEVLQLEEAGAVLQVRVNVLFPKQAEQKRCDICNPGIHSCLVVQGDELVAGGSFICSLFISPDFALRQHQGRCLSTDTEATYIPQLLGYTGGGYNDHFSLFCSSFNR